MEQLRFDVPLGTCTVSVAPESIGIFKGMGTHYLQLQIQLGMPGLGAEAGRLLYLETTLCAPLTGGQVVPLAAANMSVPFATTDGICRATPQYLITNAQLLALDQYRTGDLRLELHIRGFLPQASGYPGGSEVVEHIAVAESRWRQQLAGLGRTLGVEMLIPFPSGDEPRQAVANLLREAQRLLGGNEIDSAILQIRKALEEIKLMSGWKWPPNSTDKNDRTADQRWAVIRGALEHQASGAMHGDRGTKDHTYSRVETETLIGMTAVLLSAVP